MNSQSTAMRESSSDWQVNESRGIASAVPIRRFYWSVRRELWENHSIYITPLAVAAVAVLGYLILTLGVPVPMPDPRLLDEPYSMAAAFVVGIFYSLDTLHDERRDRSILFWKSLPVSDLTTVLSKASIPLLVLPLFSFAIAAATEVIEMGLTSVVRPAGDLSVATPSTSVFRISLGLLLYHTVTVNVLWHAPIYSWLLLVSGWARRATFLWAALPWIAICAVEKIAFNTSYCAAMLRDRFVGGPEAVQGTGRFVDALSRFTPGRFLSSPSLWIGLVVAAVFLTASVRLRRYQGAI
jgi:ABC-2 type transport system permease protein